MKSQSKVMELILLIMMFWTCWFFLSEKKLSYHEMIVSLVSKEKLGFIWFRFLNVFRPPIVLHHHQPRNGFHDNLINQTVNSLHRQGEYNVHKRYWHQKTKQCVVKTSENLIDLRIVRFEITLFKVYEFRGLVLTC